MSFSSGSFSITSLNITKIQRHVFKRLIGIFILQISFHFQYLSNLFGK